MTQASFPWRRPLVADWGDQLAEIERALTEGDAPDYAAVKSLANQQLGMREQLRIERLAKKLSNASTPIAGFAEVTIGLLGNRTLSFLPAPLAAAGLARGLNISAVEAPYDSVASFAYSPADCFGRSLDAVLVVLDESAFSSRRPMLDQAAEDEALADAENLATALAAAAQEKSGCKAIIATLPGALQV